MGRGTTTPRTAAITPRPTPTRENAVWPWLVAAPFAALVLACWPGLERPFSTPKLWLIAALDLVVVARLAAGRPSARGRAPWPWLAFLAAVSLSAATASVVLPGPFLFALLPLPLCVLPDETPPAALSNRGPVADARDAPGRAPRPGVSPVAAALCIGSALECVVVLIQYAGLDPFGWFGWRPETFASPRMRVYGTLGNPDFVAAWLCATLPLTIRLREPRRVGLVLLHLAALLATGSRVALVALPVSAAVMLGRAGRPPRRAAVIALLGAAVVGGIIWVSPSRALGTTVRGRLYLARVTAAHLRDVPVAGYGAGAFEGRFAGWQDTWLREHPAEARFAGPVDHAHNDYLEFWVDYGPLGLGVFLVLCAWLLAQAWRRDDPAALGALAALLAVACVDFPFHRPAEWALFVVLGSLTRRVG